MSVPTRKRGKPAPIAKPAGLGPYMAVAGGILVSTVAVAFLLARLNRLYQEATGSVNTVRVRLPWLRSLRGESDSRPEVTVLDLILVATAITGIATALVWFVFLAGSP